MNNICFLVCFEDFEQYSFSCVSFIAIASTEILLLIDKICHFADKTQGETILVPGVVKGLWEAHQRFGRLPWKDLFQPAIKLARYGFRIHGALAKAIEKKNDFIDSNLGLR